MDNLSSAIISLAETEVKLSLHFPMDVLGIVAWIRFAELRGIKSFAYVRMVEAGGVGIFRGIENTQLIDFSRRQKRRKRENCG